MAARRQIADKLRIQYRRASKVDKSKIRDRVVANTGLGRSTARRMLTGPMLASAGDLDGPFATEQGHPFRSRARN